VVCNANKTRTGLISYFEMRAQFSSCLHFQYLNICSIQCADPKPAGQVLSSLHMTRAPYTPS